MMKNIRLAIAQVALLALVVLAACGPSKVYKTFSDDGAYQLDSISTDPTYGYNMKNPIMIGGPHDGPRHERQYLGALRGPNGEPTRYMREGSVAQSTRMPIIMLDKYLVQYQGQVDTSYLYLDMYEDNDLLAPKGFTYRK